MDIKNLIKACQQQNRKAQEELYNQYKKPLFVLSLKYCANEAEAEDNLHNGFIEIFTNIKKFDHKGSFEGWMKRIIINKAIDTYKRKGQLYPIKDNLVEDTIVDQTDIDLPIDYLLKLIQELPDQYRVIFNLYELDDYSHKEIAALLSISEGTSKSNLHRAKLILKEKIKSAYSFQNYDVKNGQ